MAGWRGKLIYLMVIYFAGFATAIYALVPAPEAHNVSGEKGFGYSLLKTNDFALSFNAAMHEYIDIAKDSTSQVRTILKTKLDDQESL